MPAAATCSHDSTVRSLPPCLIAAHAHSHRYDGTRRIALAWLGLAWQRRSGEAQPVRSRSSLATRVQPRASRPLLSPMTAKPSSLRDEATLPLTTHETRCSAAPDVFAGEHGGAAQVRRAQLFSSLSFFAHQLCLVIVTYSAVLMVYAAWSSDSDRDDSSQAAQRAAAHRMLMHSGSKRHRSNPPTSERRGLLASKRAYRWATVVACTLGALGAFACLGASVLVVTLGERPAKTTSSASAENLEIGWHSLLLKITPGALVATAALFALFWTGTSFQMMSKAFRSTVRFEVRIYVCCSLVSVLHVRPWDSLTDDLVAGFRHSRGCACCRRIDEICSVCERGCLQHRMVSATPVSVSRSGLTRQLQPWSSRYGPRRRWPAERCQYVQRSLHCHHDRRACLGYRSCRPCLFAVRSRLGCLAFTAGQDVPRQRQDVSR